MSSHYGNSLTVVSPNQQYSPYEVPKFETKGTRRSSWSQSPQSSSYMQVKAVPVSPIPPRNSRSSLPNTPLVQPVLPLSITPNRRTRSYSSPNVITPKTLDTSSSSSHSLEERKTSPFGNGRHSVIGLPSEYPATAVHNRDGSVVSSFASSVASSLLMDEIDDFEQFFGDDRHGAKVYDDLSCRSQQSPLKCDVPKPSHIRPRSISDNTVESTNDVTSPLLHGPARPSKRDSGASNSSKCSLSSKSSRSRRRRNHGLNENDFQKITNDLSSLIMQERPLSV